MSITYGQFIEEEALFLDNEYFRAIVLPLQGCNVISLYDKANRVEIFSTPTTKAEFENRRMVFGNPILYPPNRLEDGRFTFNKRTYSFPINKPKENNHAHGLFHDKKWEIKQIELVNNCLVAQLDSDYVNEIRSSFSQSFDLQLTIELRDHQLLQTLAIHNKSSLNLPVLLGYHTNFYYSNQSSLLQMEVGKQWEFNSRNLPTGARSTYQYESQLRKGFPVNGTLIDHELEMGKNKKAIIKHPHLGLNVEYEAIEGFNFWALFNGDGNKDYFAIEPYTCITNAPNLNLPSSLTGFDWIEPNKEKKYKTKIAVKSLRENKC